MRFALLGDHPDGLDMARALAASGRHELALYSGPAVGAEYLRRWGLTFRPVGDLEEVLADPAIEAVIVAGSLAGRAAQLRRAVQSERPVLCVHPADPAPDAAYEALMIQADTRQLLLPLLPEALHPGVIRLAELVRRRSAVGHAPGDGGNGVRQVPPAAASSRSLRLVEFERCATEQVVLEAGAAEQRPALPGWDVLRHVGGEIAEVFAVAAGEEVTPEAPLLVAGRFEDGGLFQVSLLPQQPEARWRLSVVTDHGRACLSIAEGWPGPARLTWQDETGSAREETWDSWNPWPALVEVFEAALAAGNGGRGPLSWTDEVRCLELDDAARRSVARRRASTLEYQTATEEASFKGTMTLVGCGMLWGSLVLLILSYWVPWLGWLIAPLFCLFLALQLFRWAIPSRPEAQEADAPPVDSRQAEPRPLGSGERRAAP
jgi:predicted dehydrogenase